MNPSLALLAACLCLAAVSAAAAPSTLQYNVVAIPSILGTTAMSPTSINSNGEVVGNAYLIDGGSQAFLRSRTGSTLIPTLGGTRSGATSINDEGQVVGWSTTAMNSEIRPFLFSRDGELANLGTLGGRYSRATGINNSGMIVGYSSTTLPFDLEFSAFTISPGSPPQQIGTLPVETTHSFAYAINSDGVVVGSLYKPDTSESYAFVRSASGTALLPGIGGNDATATAINSIGRVAGSASDINSHQRAILFDGQKTMNLGTIADHRNFGFGFGTPAWSGAFGINSSGFVVGTFGFSGYQGRGFLYDGTSMQDLNELLEPSGFGSWEITDALAINDKGVIAAYGYRIGENIGTALLLVPSSVTVPVPEPPTMALLLFGFAGFLIGRRRQRVCALAACTSWAQHLGQRNTLRRPRPRARYFER